MQQKNCSEHILAHENKSRDVLCTSLLYGLAMSGLAFSVAPFFAEVAWPIITKLWHTVDGDPDL